MEHLPQISNPDKKVLRAPYLFDPRFIYDRKGINGFQKRCGFTWNESADPSELATLENSSFFQAWLYFGTLIEIFAIYDINIDPSDFILDSDGSRLITTAKLPYYIGLWIANALLLSPDCLDHYHDDGAALSSTLAKNSETIGKAKQVQAILDRVGAELHGLQDRTISFQDHVWTSALILCSTLRSTAFYLYRTFTLTFAEVHVIADLKSNFLTENFNRGNWCPKERACLALSANFNFSTMVLASQLGRLLTSSTHLNCSENTCEAYQVNEVSYKTEHTTADCCCEFVGVHDVYNNLPFSWKESSLAFNLIPVITFMDGKLTVKYAPSNVTSFLKVQAGLINSMWNSKITGRDSIHRSGKYIAISHVWAHGRGNPTANALPRCQLESIQVCVAHPIRLQKEQSVLISGWLVRPL
jgi:hypothetical protein